jgi:hypothetical protein
MTLNITLVTNRCIYQSADYRLTDVRTGHTRDFETQKIVLTGRYDWTATVCFSGVGHTGTIDVGKWLAERAPIIKDCPFDDLLEELLKASDWLSSVPPPDNRHSFSVGAFVGSTPVFALVSNYEEPYQPPRAVASPQMSVFTLRPALPETFISGQTQALKLEERARLHAIAAQEPEPPPDSVCLALAEANRRAAAASNGVSPACFTPYLRRTGESGGRVHGIGGRPFFPSFPFPDVAREAVTRLLDQQFGAGKVSDQPIHLEFRVEPMHAWCFCEGAGDGEAARCAILASAC